MADDARIDANVRKLTACPLEGFTSTHGQADDFIMRVFRRNPATGEETPVNFYRMPAPELLEHLLDPKNSLHPRYYLAGELAKQFVRDLLDPNTVFKKWADALSSITPPGFSARDYDSPDGRTHEAWRVFEGTDHDMIATAVLALWDGNPELLKFKSRWVFVTDNESVAIDYSSQEVLARYRQVYHECKETGARPA